MKVKTSELEGAALDYAVAVAMQLKTVVHAPNEYRYDVADGIHCSTYGCTIGPASMTGDDEEYSPSTDWSQCGPLIEEYQICLDPLTGGDWDSQYPSGPWVRGSSPLQAACRAIVSAKLGDTVDIPDELVKEG